LNFLSWNSLAQWTFENLSKTLTSPWQSQIHRSIILLMYMKKCFVASKWKVWSFLENLLTMFNVNEIFSCVWIKKLNFPTKCSQTKRNHKSVIHVYFSCLKVVIWFGVENIRFIYIIRFIIYHWNMWINLKNIRWIKSFQKH